MVFFAGQTKKEERRKNKTRNNLPGNKKHFLQDNSLAYFENRFLQCNSKHRILGQAFLAEQFSGQDFRQAFAGYCIGYVSFR